MPTIRAILLLRVRAGYEKKVLDKLYSIKEVKEAGLILGDYDIYALIEVSSNECRTENQLVCRIFDIIVDSIKDVEGVESTLTLLTFDYLSKKKWKPVSTDLVRPYPPPID